MDAVERTDSGGVVVLNTGQVEKIYGFMPSFVQDLFVSAAGWNLSRKKFGRGFSDYLAHIEETQWWTRDELIEYQNEKLKKLVHFAFENSSYYRKVFEREKVRPSEIREVTDLIRIPCLEKEGIRGNLQRIAPVHRKDLKLELKRTSGTTGTGLHVFWDRKGIMKEYAFVARHRRWTGVQPFDRQITFGGRIIVPVSRSKPPFWRMNLGENQLFFSMHHFSEKNAMRYFLKFRQFNPVFVQSYPSMIFAMAEAANDAGFSLAGPKAVFVSSETLMEHQRASIEKAFDCRVFDWYGSAELAASIGQCEKGRYHLNSEYGIVEIDKTRRFDDDGMGEMICTSFVNYGTPLIRYRIGDLIRISSSRCACGRGLPVVDEIIGRLDDTVITPDGVHLGRLCHIFTDTQFLKEAQIIQESKHELRILIVPRGRFDDCHSEMLEREFRMRFGDGIHLKFEIVDRIPRDRNGKFRAVVSKLER